MDGLRAIAELIQDEHPQIIALIISYLEPAQGSDVPSYVCEKIQPEIVKELLLYKLFNQMP